MDARRKRLIDRKAAAREGRRYYAFYRGVKDWQDRKNVNPFPPGSELAQCWDNGRKYMEDGN